MSLVEIKADGYSLKGRLYGLLEKSHPRPALLFFCGWNPGSLTWTPSDLFAWLCSRKYAFVCLTIALRGMGSQGDINKLTRSDFLQDAIAAYDFLASLEGVDQESISCVGESFGAYLSCLLSAKRLVKNLVLRVPTDYPNTGFSEIPHKQFAGNLSREWKQQKHQPDESFALQAIHNFEQHIFIVASEHDELVPRQTTENYLSATADQEKCEYVLMKQTGHALINPFKGYEFIKILFGIVSKPVFQSNLN